MVTWGNMRNRRGRGREEKGGRWRGRTGEGGGIGRKNEIYKVERGNTRIRVR